MRSGWAGALLLISLSFQSTAPANAQQPASSGERIVVSQALERRIATLEVDRSAQSANAGGSASQVRPIDRQLEQLRTRLAELNQLRRTAGSMQPVTPGERLATIAAIEKRIADLEVERPQLEAQYTSNWPEIRAIELQLGQLRARLAQLARSQAIGQQSDAWVETPAGNAFQSR